jgi:uncharacterized protein (TIGR00251 family)
MTAASGAILASPVAPLQNRLPSASVSASQPFLRERSGGVELDLVVQPRASRSVVVGIHDGRLKVSLAAPPVDGEANDALVEFLSSLVRLPKRAVRVVRGESGRRKTVALEGAAADAIERSLARVLS